MMITFIMFSSLLQVTSLLGLAFLQPVEGQVTPAPIATNIPGLSSTCIAVVNQAVACNSSLLWAGQGRFESDDTLNGLCTSACTSALSTWTRRVNAACGTERWEDDGGDAWLAQAWPELINERYNALCLKNSAGQFCNAVLRDLSGIDPSNQKATGTLSPSYGCSNCLLSLLQTELEMPLTSNSRLSTLFSTLTSSCKSTNYTIATPTATTAWTIPANYSSWSTTLFSAMPTSSSTGCVGKLYTIKSGDTCQSIAASQGISTIGLVTANNLASKCIGFPASGTLCIPTAAQCKVYTTKVNDTCASIAEAYGVTWTQIVSWNPIVGIGCTKLSSYVGYQFCVSNPGGSWVNPNPWTATTTTGPGYTYSSHSFTSTYTQVPLQTLTGTLNGTSEIPFANGTRMDCVLYSTGSPNSTTFDGVTTPNPLTCAQIASGYGVALSDMITWNPSLVGLSPCYFAVGQQYCVQYLPLNFTDETPYCTQQYATGPEDNCTTVMEAFGIEMDQFYAWNPDVGPNCETWKNGYSYCIEVAHFRQPGIVSICNSFVMANQTEFMLNPCQIIETAYGLSHARFVAWNPAVLSNCTGIYHHYDYCVSIPNYKPTYSTTSQIPAATWTPTDWTVVYTASVLFSSTANGAIALSTTKLPSPSSTSKAKTASTKSKPSTS